MKTKEIDIWLEGYSHSQLLRDNLNTLPHKFCIMKNPDFSNKVTIKMLVPEKKELVSKDELRKAFDYGFKHHGDCEMVAMPSSYVTGEGELDRLIQRIFGNE